MIVPQLLVGVYKFDWQVFGHVGECTGRRPEVPNNADVDLSPAVVAPGSVPRSSLTPREAATHHRGSKSATDEEERVCIVVGDVNTTYSWYGFLRNLSLEAGGGYRFMFTYPPSMQVYNPRWEFNSFGYIGLLAY